MLTRMLVAVLLTLSICGPGIQGARAADVAAQRDLVNGGVVGLISGGVTGTYVRIAADLANALDDGYQLRVLPIIGKGSVRNIEDLLLLRGIDVAIVQSDVLDFYKRGELVSNIEGKIRYITKLYNEEVHVLARSEYGTIDDLAGKRVNFGTEGSGTFMTASIVFDDLGIDVDVGSDPEPIALEKLRTGEIDAMVFVGGKPVAFIGEVDRSEQLHLLAIPPERIKAAYVPSELTPDVYPKLIDPGDPVETVAVSAVLAAYNWPEGHPRRHKLDRFIQSFSTNFNRLLEPPFHPKWQEVDLTAQVPGWQRITAAEQMAEAAE
ncbi:MAG: TAXI family TRAP transporter solute-binding subunit [Geminicoccaceae bacterium]